MHNYIDKQNYIKSQLDTFVCEKKQVQVNKKISVQEKKDEYIDKRVNINPQNI